MVAKNRGQTVTALLVIPLACLGLGACGSSSGGSSSSASTPASTPTTTGATPSTSTGTTPASTATTSTSTKQARPITTGRQFALVYECLRRNGVKLPPLDAVRKQKLNLSELKINTQSPQFQAKSAKCSHEVLG
jgi:hypothetical protein